MSHLINLVGMAVCHTKEHAPTENLHCAPQKKKKKRDCGDSSVEN